MWKLVCTCQSITPSSLPTHRCQFARHHVRSGVRRSRKWGWGHCFRGLCTQSTKRIHKSFEFAAFPPKSFKIHALQGLKKLKRYSASKVILQNIFKKRVCIFCKMSTLCSQQQNVARKSVARLRILVSPQKMLLGPRTHS